MPCTIYADKIVHVNYVAFYVFVQYTFVTGPYNFLLFTIVLYVFYYLKRGD